MNNRRQQRAAGLAAVELAQRVHQELAQRRNGSHTWVASDGSSGHDEAGGRHRFGWRDAMDVVVRWRQIGEPNDQVRCLVTALIMCGVCSSCDAMDVVVCWRQIGEPNDQVR